MFILLLLTQVHAPKPSMSWLICPECNSQPMTLKPVADNWTGEAASGEMACWEAGCLGRVMARLYNCCSESCRGHPRLHHPQWRASCI
ncbi:hypothetical protein PGT21_023121 [Puccinia graminis f. sp. tritici]|uniref:Secreted protein n=1 Tax=Puccinia graminis f. sp. tritici TaxID=56615 RepID=A0A5B0RF22_PUCGR|nr:hypothetical protein PGT21_023121 [Puccinia graminis f. sp. tritici]KAA1123515.1 hypothetical protein PGTUg99_023803 [Puccinia graminis f. sp. tritici]